MLKYFIYLRKSTDEEDRQVLSIDAQIAELSEIARQLGIHVVRTYEESMSAKEPGRPEFNEMLAAIERGEADAILCWALNRLARNFDDAGKLIGLLQRGALQEIRTSERVYLPQDNVMLMAIEFGIANQFIQDLSRDVKRGLREKVRRGIYPSKAPLGYINDLKTHTIEPHPENFSKVRHLFALLLTGEHTLKELQQEAQRIGLVGSESKQSVALSTLCKLFRNPFYCGVFRYLGELHDGVHVPVITQAQFDEAQVILATLGQTRKSRDEQSFLFRGFATCASCGCQITSERHVKKSGRAYFYYRCTGKNREKPCPERSFLNRETFHAEVKRNVELVCLSDEWRDVFLDRIKQAEAEADQINQRTIIALKSELEPVRLKLTRTNQTYTEGHLDLAEYKELKNPLVAQKKDLEQKLIALESKRLGRLELFREWVLTANQATQWLSEENFPAMKAFLLKVGSNREVGGQAVSVRFKKPWNLLAKTNLAVRQTTSSFQINSLMGQLWNDNRTHFEAVAGVPTPFPTVGNPSEVVLAA